MVQHWVGADARVLEVPRNMGVLYNGVISAS